MPGIKSFFKFRFPSVLHLIFGWMKLVTLVGCAYNGERTSATSAQYIGFKLDIYTRIHF